MAEIIYRAPITFGCDPEFFFAQGGKVIGSEKVLPKSGNLGVAAGSYPNPRAFVLDGVQAELNPHATSCRAELGGQIALAFKTLKDHLGNMGNVKACFDAVIELDKDELKGLSEKSRQFGCAPSENFYDKDCKVKANAATYRKRSAGGHIHLGLGALLKAHRERLIPIMDTLIGNTCVMIDRCPDAAERRKNYGRAGEYRLPQHGIEYRTLSNFWLRSYPLMAFVMGLARLSVGILNTTLQEPVPERAERGIVYQTAITPWNAESDLIRRVNLNNIRKAINTNDYDLARQNWLAVKSFISDYVPSTTAWRQEVALDSGNLLTFEYFLDQVKLKGIERWFPEDPIDHWCGLVDAGTNNRGWETFLRFVVEPQRLMDYTVLEVKK
jgi:hypothetical protein